MIHTKDPTSSRATTLDLGSIKIFDTVLTHNVFFCGTVSEISPLSDVSHLTRVFLTGRDFSTSSLLNFMPLFFIFLFIRKSRMKFII
jgi:hypothetical protein